MNRLWVRLSLYFGGLVLIGALLIIVLAQVLASDRVEQTLLPAQLRASGGVVEALSDYYRTQGSWRDVDEFMRGVQAATPLWSSRLTLTLVDVDGQPIYRNRRGHGGDRPPPPLLSLPIEVDGEPVGSLQISTGGPPSRGGPPDGLPQQVSRLLLILALGGGAVGIVVSVLASRSLTAPLRRLAMAAHDIGARQFSRRVPLSGTDEVREVALAFNEMAAQLEGAETLRRTLVADVAHELRTPLSVIQGNLRAILDDVYPLEKAEITRLYTQTRLLSRLVDDLHDLAQAEAGQLSLNRQPTDLATLAAEIVESHGPGAEEAGVTLQLQAQPDLPAITVDPMRLAQVLHNLIANALRHTPTGGTITVGLSAAAGGIQLVVQDTGEGVAPEHLPHLFDRFYRTDRSRTRDTGGAGLGLAIVRAIVEAHGGTATVESDGPGRGSRFLLWLPLH
jgi:signal transduction histidine kinase